VDAAITGELDAAEYRTDPVFGFEVPRAVRGVPAQLLDPRGTWADPSDYDVKAAELAGRFASNFEQFADRVPPEVTAAGPTV
jgi:phosphoenolpyruvate carboxykinase (ATP)